MMELAQLLYRANDAVFYNNPDLQLVKDLRAALIELNQKVEGLTSERHRA